MPSEDDTVMMFFGNKGDMTEHRCLEGYAIKVFREHWARVVKNIKKNPSFYKKHYDCFEADTVARQKKLCERFYALSHAELMASLDERTIKRRLSCYLPVGIEYALREYEDNQKEREKYVKDLVRNEYVLFSSSQIQDITAFNEGGEDLSVRGYPAKGVLYDDWFENTLAGVSCGGTCVLMKSTGEPFIKSEIDWLKKAIVQGIDGNDFERLWSFELEPINRRQIWIKIYELERPTYTEGLMNYISSLSSEPLLVFAKKSDYLFKRK